MSSGLYVALTGNSPTIEHEDVRKRASQAFPMEPVRSFDAIHLATALEFLQLFPEMRVCSLDKRIINKLELLGMISAL